MAWRDARRTRELLAQRVRAREDASRWLGSGGGLLPDPVAGSNIAALPPLDALAGRAEVIGIVEATHGSREFGDVRVMVTRYLVERHGYRLIALEASADRLALLNRYASGAALSGDSIARVIDAAIWIGRAPQRPMRWVGGLFAPESDPNRAFQPFLLPRDFDGVIFLPTVTADEIPTVLPVIPPRRGNDRHDRGAGDHPRPVTFWAFGARSRARERRPERAMRMHPPW
ncbi:MAG: hypothetical protein ACRELV_13735 [Longimicrobiales bacterium]